MSEKHHRRGVPRNSAPMGEPCEAKFEEDKFLQEKGRKRKLKTPSQVEALEKFYDEHKYPSESMKLELAEKIGLTEKQVSGWFCHRRLKDRKVLKDEAPYANGRLDRSSGVVQDHGSGLRQDSCGSTKVGDYRHIEPREVESQRLYHQDIPADLTYEKSSRHDTGNSTDADETSSESNLALRERFFNQTEDLYGGEPTRYLTQNGAITPRNTNSVLRRPSGYLKLKGNAEHAAITAVKRQLGRHYQEDGPPLGIGFDPLPPGAFESETKDAVAVPYDLNEPTISHLPEVRQVYNQPICSTRYNVYSSKKSSQDSYMEKENPRTIRGPDCSGSYPCSKKNQKLLFPNCGKPLFGQSSSFDINDVSAGEFSVYDSRSSCRKAEPAIEGTRPDYDSSHQLQRHYEKIDSGQRVPYLNEYVDNEQGKIAQKGEHSDHKSSNLMSRQSESHGMEERVLYRRMEKEEHYEARNAIKKHKDPVRAKMLPPSQTLNSSRVWHNYPQQDHALKASSTEMVPWTNQIRRSAMEMPSSFSEDETAETSSSVD